MTAATPTGGAISASAAAAHARAVVARSGTSFGAGMKILSRPRREGMFAVYAFCREIDDIADEGGTQDDKLKALMEWRNELSRLYDGRASRPTSQALAPVIERYNLPKEEFVYLIEGMEMDAKGPIVAPSFDTLYAYTRRVAGAVGMLSMRVFGAWRGGVSKEFALSLADALQLTNILRDVGEDAAIGRLYLPRELLDKYDIPVTSPSEVVRHPQIGKVASELGEIARTRFDAARGLIAFHDWRKLRPALLMMGAYERYHAKLEARGWDKVGPPISMSKFEKLLIALRWALAPPVPTRSTNPGAEAPS